MACPEMSGGVGGSVDAASLIAALAVGAGQYGGSHEVHLLVTAWDRLGMDATAWQKYFDQPNKHYSEDVWSPIEHPPGFDPHGVRCSRFQILNAQLPDEHLGGLITNLMT